MPSSLNGTGVTFNDATTLQSGNIPTANLGSGTANSSTFLRGDKTWQSLSVPSTDIGGIGSHVLAVIAQNGTNSLNNALFITPGQTFAGSALRINSSISRSAYTGVAVTSKITTNATYTGGGTSLSGTWSSRGNQAWFQNYNRGSDFAAEWHFVLFVRIA
jgi:hypothetical protein